MCVACVCVFALVCMCVCACVSVRVCVCMHQVCIMSCAINSSMISTMQVPLSSQCVCVCARVCTTSVRITLIFTSVGHNHASYVVCTCPYIQTTRCVLRVCMCVCVYHYCAYRTHSYISKAQSCIVRCLHPLLHTDQQVRVACVHVCLRVPLLCVSHSFLHQ